MAKYLIFFKNQKQYHVHANSASAALSQWLDEQAYETIGEAAREYHGEITDFSAIRIEN